MNDAERSAGWGEGESRKFLDLGAFFVPDREEQMAMFCDLIPVMDRPSHVVDLCCGEGLLALELLRRFPRAIVHGYDGSATMLDSARSKLAEFGERFDPQLFDLSKLIWRFFNW